MAVKFLFSGAVGTATGADWVNAYTTLTAAVAGLLAGDTLKVHKTHSENYAAATTFTFPGTATAPNLIICVDKDLADVQATGALISASSGFNLIVNGNYLIDGINFAPSGGFASTGAGVIQFGGAGNSRIRVRNSVVSLPNNNTSRVSGGGTTGQFIDFDNVTLATGGPNGVLPGSCIVRNSTPFGQATIFGTGVVPGGVMQASINGGTAVYDSCDLTAIGSGKSLLSGATTVNTFLTLVSCKINAAVTPVSGLANNGASELIMMNCNDTAGALRHERHNFRGKQEIAANVYRAGGATDGTTAHSWRLTSTATNTRFLPFESLDVDFMVPAAKVGLSTTLTIHTITDGVTLTDADLWLIGSVLITAGSRAGTKIETQPSILAAGTNLADDTPAAWTHALTTPVKQKLVLTFTPQFAGMHRFRLGYSRASSVIYACPSPDVA